MDLAEMLKEVQILEDVEAIKNMHNEYVICLRNNQFEEMIDCFADDAILEIRELGRRTGKEEIAKLFREHIARVKIPRGHSLVQPVITVDGNTAEGHWTLYHFNYDYTKPAGKGCLTEWEQGFYECRYVRVGGVWKFSYLKFICPWPKCPA
jgi:ketosteroid isomerase-like protein